MGNSSKGSVKPEEAPKLMSEPQVMIIDYKSNVNLVQSGNSIIALNTTMTADDTWIVDSGATDHMSGNRGLFKTLRLCPENLRVKVANGVVTKVAGIGSVLLTEYLEVHNVLFVPALTCNLISVSKLIKGKRCRVIFDESGCTFQDLNSRRTIGNSKEWDGLYYLEGSNRRKRQANKALVSSHSNNEDVLLWHQRLGHPSFDYMKHLFPSLFNKNSVPFSCETCQLAKQKRSTYPQLSYKPTTPFTIIHSDIWGPAKTKTQANARWFVTFIDDHTRTTWVYLMKEKSEVNQIFQSFYSYVKNQFHTSIQILRSDNAKEYLSSSMKEFLTKQGIHHQTSCVYTPQQNGVAERKNRHLLEVTRAIMIERNVPKIFWGDAILTAAYLINRMPSKVLNFSTPIQKLLETYPNSPLIHTLPPKTFGCVVFVHKQVKSKLDPRADKCIFVGYSPSQKGYKCYSPITRKTIVSKDVVFYESEAYYPKLPIQGESDGTEWLIVNLTPKSSLEQEILVYPEMSSNPVDSERAITIPEIEITQDNLSEHNSQPRVENNAEINTEMISEDQHDEELQSGNEATDSRVPSAPRNDHESDSRIDPEEMGWPIALRKGVRSCTQHPIQKFVSYGNLSAKMQSFVINTAQVKIPHTFQQAMTDPNWKLAAEEELRALKENKTWEITNLPRGKKAVGCRWIFTPKFNPDGSIDKYKARLVAKGYTQTYGIDYEETFAPVAKFSTINILLSIAANLDWSLHQLDIKNAFLNGDLEE